MCDALYNKKSNVLFIVFFFLLRVLKVEIFKVSMAKANSLKVSEFIAAVRGRHYCKKEKVLQCSYEFGNVFDVFVIKTCKADGTIVSHLPREISTSTKFLLDRQKVSFSSKWSRNCM